MPTLHLLLVEPLDAYASRFLADVEQTFGEDVAVTRFTSIRDMRTALQSGIEVDQVWLETKGLALGMLNTVRSVLPRYVPDDQIYEIYEGALPVNAERSDNADMLALIRMLLSKRSGGTTENHRQDLELTKLGVQLEQLKDRMSELSERVGSLQGQVSSLDRGLESTKNAIAEFKRNRDGRLQFAIAMMTAGSAVTAAIVSNFDKVENFILTLFGLR